MRVPRRTGRCARDRGAAPRASSGPLAGVDRADASSILAAAYDQGPFPAVRLRVRREGGHCPRGHV
ncbi:hypothetical protein DB32_006315 [Sandaracinus amylolyticus]|uniref:Uncharacterized protein n=1 Tax=Sandaracinus amylolyticus TaxID=927083 RepID=A0A0F6YLG3_9BACT|nr:hypothetical protein DB32_006315 [Sandaracinus amylolyticus]